MCDVALKNYLCSIIAGNVTIPPSEEIIRPKLWRMRIIPMSSTYIRFFSCFRLNYLIHHPSPWPKQRNIWTSLLQKMSTTARLKKGRRFWRSKKSKTSYPNSWLKVSGFWFFPPSITSPLFLPHFSRVLYLMDFLFVTFIFQIKQ